MMEYMLLAGIMYALAVAGFGASATRKHPDCRNRMHAATEGMRVGGAEPPNCVACNCGGDAVSLWGLSSPAERAPAAAIGVGM